MPEGLIIEFEGVGRADYDDAVNRELGLEQGEWPAGLSFHAGGAKPGGWVVFEVWDSRASQERFMGERLGPALQAAGVTAPPRRVEWLELAAHVNLEG